MGQKKQKGTVSITNFQDRIRLRWRHGGNRYSLNLNAYTELNLLQAKKLVIQIEQDILLGTFDQTLEKYAGKRQKVSTKPTGFTELFEYWVKNWESYIMAFQEVERKEGSTFVSLELTGQAELLQSKTTGKWYARVRRCRIPSTFDTEVAKSMVGQKFPGEIVKVICDPYEYVNQRTGEVIMLQHNYAYSPDSNPENAVGHTPVSSVSMY